MFKIVKNLPIPEEKKTQGSKGRSSIYPFGEMEVGDCLKFDVRSSNEPQFKKIYSAAMSYARRHSGDYKFMFAEIKPGLFGCWKVRLKPGEEKAGRRRRKTKAEIMSIKYEDMDRAMKEGGSTAGAAKILGLSHRTFTRLKEMYEKGLVKK